MAAQALKTGAGKMWGVEHTAMAISASCFVLWFIAKANWSWLGAALLSQFPFWGGFAYSWMNADDAPVNINLSLNLMVAGAFVWWAEWLQKQDRGGIVHIWVCLVFTMACSVDVLQVMSPVSFYQIAQGAVHYMALFVIGGRAYVRGIDGNHRHNRNLRGSGKSGGLV